MLQTIETQRDNIIHWLKGNVLSIKFTKQDGSIRVMKCTLQNHIIPEKTEEVKPRKINLEQIRVYDLEKKSWRSFKIGNILSITFEVKENV
jgi:hypothetical protein